MPSQPDLTEFVTLSSRRNACKVAAVCADLSDVEVAQLQAACDADKGEITSGAILKWLATRGHKVNISSITCHRSKVCACNG
ncbi:MAG: hypothetical protein NVS3B1_22160 [Marmoricola sp.]